MHAQWLENGRKIWEMTDSERSPKQEPAVFKACGLQAGRHVTLLYRSCQKLLLVEPCDMAVSTAGTYIASDRVDYGRYACKHRIQCKSYEI